MVVFVPGNGAWWASPAAVLDPAKLHLDVFLSQFFDGVGQRRVGHAHAAAAAAFGVVLAQRAFDVGLGGDLQADVHPQQVTQAVNGVQVGGIG